MAIFSFNIHKLSADPRHWQIGFLLSFWALGVGTRGWSHSGWPLLELVLVCGLSQGVLTGLMSILSPWLRDIVDTKVSASPLAPLCKATVYAQMSESPLAPLGKGGTGLQSPPCKGGFRGIKPKIESLTEICVHDSLDKGETGTGFKVPLAEIEDFGKLSRIFLAPGLKSAVITALGLSLLLRANHWPTLLLAGAAAIASKFFLKIDAKHAFNPANFGIMTVLILSRDAWVSPGQWGNAPWLAALFLGAGGLILGKVGRWETTAVFLGSYGALELVRTLWLGWPGTLAWHHLENGSLLVFAFFMISDPRSTPDHPWGRALWALTLASLTFTLRYGAHLSTAPFWALFLCSPLTWALDLGLPAPRFVWVKTAS